MATEIGLSTQSVVSARLSRTTDDRFAPGTVHVVGAKHGGRCRD